MASLLGPLDVTVLAEHPPLGFGHRDTDQRCVSHHVDRPPSSMWGPHLSFQLPACHL